MPPLEPSFHTLYKQGRFRTHGPLTADSNHAMQQTERFAVAMVAFALKHDDQDFRDQFMKRVCDSSQHRRSAGLKIAVEVDGCGDLEVQCGSDVFFIEFKIESPLQAHQDPAKKQFTALGGYGRNIIDRCQKIAKRGNYIVVRKELGSLPDKRPSRGPKCLYKTWNEIYKCGCKSGISKDLFQSLGLLNVKPFTHMITRQYKLGETARVAGQVYKLLEAVADECGFKRPKWEATADGAYAGMNFLAANSPKVWAELIKPKGNVLGWYGYENRKLEVCFYCGTRGAAQEIRKRLTEAFPENESPDVDAENVAFITLEPKKSRSDQDWFVSVFGSVRKGSLA